ncbi:MAG: NAD(+)/NADH kinase [Candidatus Thorarchaeota archaeon]
MHFISKESCILITSSKKADSKKIAIDAFSKLKKRGYRVLIDSFLAKKVEGEYKAYKDDKIDLILVFGGDGTILKTFANWKNTPILGINCGRVGFLSEIIPEEFEEAINKIEKQEYFIEEHNTISIYSENYPSLSAVNDVLVAADNVGQNLLLKVYVDDQYFYTFYGDGLIVASCTGSSAHSLSAGGSLLMPNINAVILVPVCPFSKKIVPIVIPSGKKIKIKNLSKYRAGKVVIDGKSYYSLGYKESISVSESKDKINFIRFSDNYIERVREKLLKFNFDDLNEDK